MGRREEYAQKRYADYIHTMRLIKTYIRFFFSTLGLKLFCAVLWVVFTFAVYFFYPQSAQHISTADIAFSLIAVLFPRVAVYLYWAILFAFIRLVLLKRKAISFSGVLSLTLVLNFAEILFFYGDFGRIVNVSKHYGWFNMKTWATLPDFPAGMSLILASVVFAALYFRFVEKKLASDSD